MQRAAAPSKWFTPLQLGSIGKLKHRIVLAPLTRNRASEPNLTASPLAVQYYRQRASQGTLLITVATHISPESLAYPCTPGIWSSTQVDSWKDVTRAVHEEQGFIVCQLWHTGRVAHPSFGEHPSNADLQYQPCVSASSIPIMTYKGVKEHGTPRALSKTDIERICQDYIRAAQNAKDAGFDGVELHAAHGYLIDQFLNASSNQRNDVYGGSNPENRCRFLGEALDAILQVWPSDKVGVRLSPHDSPNGDYTYYGAKDDNPDAVYSHAVSLVNSKQVAYLLLTEPRWVGRHDGDPDSDPGFQMPLLNLPKYRSLFKSGVLIGAGGFTPSSSLDDTCQDYDALAFGRWFLANPDFPERLRKFHEQAKIAGGAATDNALQAPPLNRYDRDTFYSQGPEGYIDYPSLDFAGSVQNPKQGGMVLDKHALVQQADVGTSLKQSEKNRQHRQSKL